MASLGFPVHGAISGRETALFGTRLAANTLEIDNGLLQAIDLIGLQAHNLASPLWSAQSRFQCRLVAISSLAPSLGATLEAIHLKMAKDPLDSTLYLTQRTRQLLILSSSMAWVEGPKVPGQSPMIRLFIGQKNGFHMIPHLKRSGYTALGTIQIGVTRVFSMFTTSPRRSLNRCRIAP